ncbi:MAG TPA: GEVED domain-containing protein, partial [Chitinophagaceae bacterium]|nr:GEVED domain-containing protein [Chitinophagaceae bacterium]
GLAFSTGTNNILLEGNRIRRLFDGAPAGTNTGYGIYLIVAGGLGTENKIINNVISDLKGNGTIYGIYLSGASFAQVYHNTISLDYTAATAGTTYGIYNSGTTGTDIRNNIVTIRRGGTGTKYAMYYASNPSIANNNDFLMNSAAGTNYPVYANATAFASFATYQSTVLTQDQQSVSINPNFNNPAMFDYKPTEVTLNDLGTPVGVANDINNVGRAATPDMGAYEFSVAATDVGMFSFDSPGTGGCYDPAQTVSVTIKNFGTSAIDFSVNPATVYCDVTGPVTTTLSGTPTGILASGATMTVVLGPGFNMTANGSYTFGNLNVVMTGDGNLTNDVLSATYNRTVGLVAGTISVPSNSVCISSPSPTLTLSGNYGGAIQWQQSTTSASGPWTNVGTGTTSFTPASLTDPVYYFQAELSCNGNVAATNVITINVNNPQLLGTTPGSRCGTGSVTLGATAAPGIDVKWYANATGGTALGTGTTFNTPTISSTTDFYAEAVSGAGLLTGLGCNLVPTASGFNAKRGLQFDAYQTFTLMSADFYAGYSGAATIAIELQNSAGTVLQSFNITVNSSNAAVGWHTMPLNMIIPAGTGYKLLATFTGASTSNYSHSSGADYSLAAFNNLGGVGLITSGLDFGPVVAPTTYWYFYNIVVSAGCNSLRTPVTATVNTSPTISLSASTTTLCAGDPTTLSVSSPNDPNYTYTWLPGGATGSSVTFNPSSTTTYTLNALDNTTGTYAGCGNQATQLITVNPVPTPVSVTPASTTVCAGSNVSLMASGGLPVPSAYCQPSYSTGTTSGDYITQVTLNGTSLNNLTGPSASPYYTLYPASGSTTAAVTAGTSYTLTVSPGTWSSAGNDIAAFIDYNQNGVFDTGEKLGQVNDVGASPATGIITFTIPTGAYNGPTRFRVREVYSNTAIDGCTTATFGETEDYQITISGGYNPGSYTWSPSTNLVSTTANPAQVVGISASTTYVATFTNGYGCTASGSSVITVNPTSATSETHNECGSSYTWNGNTYTTAGTYTHSYTNMYGCDSIATLNLTFNPCNTTLNLTCFIEG